MGLALALGGCGAAGGGPESAETRYALRIDGVGLRAQVMVRAEEQRNGLMFREALEPDEGMLFIYERPQAMSFWMKNTWIPLDVGFFTAEGVLTEVRPLYPRDENPVRSRGSDLMFALEMRQGWFAEKGLKPGAKLDLEGVRKAVARRRGREG